MDLNLKGKTVVICGGSTGIGRATAEEFAKEGCNVAVCSRSQEKIAAFCAEFDALPYPYYAKSVNAIEAEAVQAFADEVVARFGRIDVWVNCAGGNRHGPVSTLAGDDYRFIVDMNMTTLLNGYQAATRYMMPQKSGVIINIASLSGKEGVAYRAMYGAIKAGVINLTATTAAELAPYGIRIVSVSPGVIRTALMEKSIRENGDKLCAQICLHRVGEPVEIARPVVFLASDAASYITGTNVNVAGGSQNVADADLPWTSPWQA